MRLQDPERLFRRFTRTPLRGNDRDAMAVPLNVKADVVSEIFNIEEVFDLLPVRYRLPVNGKNLISGNQTGLCRGAPLGNISDLGRFLGDLSIDVTDSPK